MLVSYLLTVHAGVDLLRPLPSYETDFLNISTRQLVMVNILAEFFL